MVQNSVTFSQKIHTKPHEYECCCISYLIRNKIKVTLFYTTKTSVMLGDLDLDLLEHIIPLNNVTSTLSASSASETSITDIIPAPSTKKTHVNLKRRRNYDASRLEGFLETIRANATADFKTAPLAKKKCTDDIFTIPTYDNYECLLSLKYKKEQLKIIAKHYGIKLSGTNSELIARIYTHIKMSGFTIRIQRVLRGYLQRYTNKLRGPAFLNRSLCTNTDDFLTMEDIKNIRYTQFVSYRDDDGFVYGFDVISLYNLKQNTSLGEDVKNPYTRTPISKQVFVQMNRLLKIMKRVYKSPIDIDIEKEDEIDLTISDRVNRIFMEMDSHGHYTCPSWFTSLDRGGLIRFIQELSDIWFYRASLTPAVRYTICPHDPLQHYSLFINILRLEENVEQIREKVIHIIETVIFSGVDSSARALGVIYVLQSFTLVNYNARQTMPWLYEAVAYDNNNGM